MRNYLLFIILSTLALDTSAALISGDWMSTGDNLITHDTETGLEWLDLTETKKMNYNYISSQLGSGGEFEGFRYATKNEMDSLFLAFDLPLDAAAHINSEPAGDPAILNFNSIMGETLDDSGVYGTYGIIGEVSTEGAHHYLGVAYDYYNGVNLYSTSTIYSSIPDDAIWDDPTSSIDYGGIGSFLVRPAVVPVPAAVWLFGSGLIGLIGLARHKN